jgi:hypothetical protein
MGFAILIAVLGITLSQMALGQPSPNSGAPGSSGISNFPMQKPSTSDSTSGGMKKYAPTTGPGGFYALLDLRHTRNDYYDADGGSLRRDPALHAKFRLGAKFYSDTLDVSLGAGGSKLPASQRAYQKRPDVTIDTYPLKGQFLNVLVYGNALFPVRSSDLDPTEYADGDRYDRDYRRAIDATVIAVGVAPNLKFEGTTAWGRPSIVLGADAWTRMYSKPLYIGGDDGSRALGLIEAEAPNVETPFEDRAMRYVHQESLALGFNPVIFPKLQAEIAGYSESRYIPRYYLNQKTDSWDYNYQPERVSFTRFRLAFDLTASTSLSNELYFFRNGFFAEDRINDQRRYRNIIRLAIKM